MGCGPPALPQQVEQGASPQARSSRQQDSSQAASSPPTSPCRSECTWLPSAAMPRMREDSRRGAASVRRLRDAVTPAVGGRSGRATGGRRSCHGAWVGSGMATDQGASIIRLGLAAAGQLQLKHRYTARKGHSWHACPAYSHPCAWQRQRWPWAALARALKQGQGGLEPSSFLCCAGSAPAAAAQPPAAVWDMRQGDPDQLHRGFQLQWQACLGGRERHRRPGARMPPCGSAAPAQLRRRGCASIT